MTGRGMERQEPGGATRAVQAKVALGVVVLCLLGLAVAAWPGKAGQDSSPEATTAAQSTPGRAAPTKVPRSDTAVATSAPTSTAPGTTLVPGRVGFFVTAPGRTEVVGTGRLVTYSVEVEEAVGLPVADVAATIDAALDDPRSWIADGSTSFQRVTDGAEVRIVLATPPTIDERCLPLQTNGIFSCRQGNTMNINSLRWRNGTEDWPLDVDAYRAHVINHEMGHVLGHDHVGCPGPGELAPAMMQQTKGLDGCIANVWPFPDRGPAGG